MPYHVVVLPTTNGILEREDTSSGICRPFSSRKQCSPWVLAVPPLGSCPLGRFCQQVKKCNSTLHIQNTQILGRDRIVSTVRLSHLEVSFPSDSSAARYQIFTFVYLLLIQYQVTVTAAFLLVETIFDEFEYPASVLLLATIFGLLFQVLQQPGVGYPRYRGLLWANYGLCAVLFVLYLALFALRVHAIDQQVLDDESSTYFVNGYPVESVLDVTFDGLFAIAALEVLVGSIYILVTHRKYRTSNTVRAPFSRDAEYQTDNDNRLLYSSSPSSPALSSSNASSHSHTTQT